MTRGCACPERLCREIVAGTAEPGCRVAADILQLAPPVIPGPLRPATPVLPLCQACGIRGCVGHPVGRRRWWQRPRRR